MKEIKLRVWTEDEGFLYSDTCLGYKGSETDNNLRLKDFFEFVTTEFCPKPFFIQEFTGLTDKNGRQIFDGDLVNYLWVAGEHEYRKETNEEVFFEDAMFVFGRSNLFTMADCNFLSETLEVVGNIFENKDLIK